MERAVEIPSTSYPKAGTVLSLLNVIIINVQDSARRTSEIENIMFGSGKICPLSAMVKSSLQLENTIPRPSTACCYHKCHNKGSK